MSSERKEMSEGRGLERRDLLKAVPIVAGYPLVGQALFAAGQAQKLKLKKKAQKVPKKPQIPAKQALARRGGLLRPAPEPSPEEKRVARYLADGIKHEIVSAAAHPLGESLPAGTPAGAVHRLLKRTEAAKQTRVQEKARAMLKGAMSDRHAIFGRFAESGADFHRQVSRGGDATLEDLLNKAFDAKAAALGELKTVGKRSPTRVRIEESKDLGLYRSYMDIYTPQRLDFAWQTEVPEATSARWEIEPPAGFSLPESKRQGGAGRAPGGSFHIDFGGFLPPAPSDTPITFHVRVQPMHGRESKTEVQMLPRPVGEPSPWVPVTYKKQDWEQPTFDLPEPEGHYQTVSLYIQKIHCVEETDEVGADTILLGGFFALSNGTVRETGTWTVSDDFDTGETIHRDLRWATFDFFNADMRGGGNLLARPPVDAAYMPWPRTYLFHLMLAERDDGGFNEVVRSVVNRVLEEIEPYVAAYLGMAAGAAIGSLAGPLGTLVGAVIGLVVGAVVGWVFGLFSQLFDNEDDIIGSKSYTLELWSSRVAAIHKLAGTVHQIAGGKTEFVSQPQKIDFVGDGGHYEITVYWKAMNRIFG